MASLVPGSQRNNRRSFLKQSLALTMAASAAPYDLRAVDTPSPAPQTPRELWLLQLQKISEPVLSALGSRRLKAEMPVECQPGELQSRQQCTYLEAMARLLMGLAPWLELGPTEGAEGQLCKRYADLAREGIASGTDPHSPDYMNFGTTPQSLVDTAFLALAICRAPNKLWKPLDTQARKNVVTALKATRPILPGPNNWLLFSAMVEAGLCLMGEQWDPVRIDYAIRQHEQWYLGDGEYGDGPHFHWDYYNSFVIHPLLLQVLDTVSASSDKWNAFRPKILARAQRYAAIQERMISPEATYPAIGRSLAYRFGAFHLLADISLRQQLPQAVSPEQVRCALTALMQRQINAPGTFDKNGWLTIGFAGHQPSIGEKYISTGSCYLCSAAWLPLGLAKDNAFWVGPTKQWTSQKLWSGEDLPTDHAID